MTATKSCAWLTMLALLASSGEPLARGWGWHRRSAPADSSVLNPNLEGLKGESDSDGVSDVEEMRRWLQQRDDERRQMGITVPDTVEPFVPPVDPGQRWPQRGGESSRSFGDGLAPPDERSGIGEDAVDADQASESASSGGPHYRKHHGSRHRGGSRARHSRRHGTSSAHHARSHGSSKSSGSHSRSRKSGSRRH